MSLRNGSIVSHLVQCGSRSSSVWPTNSGQWPFIATDL